MSRIAKTPVGFDVVSVRHEGVLRSMARFRCVRCDATLNIPTSKDGDAGREMLAHLARVRGWKAHADTKQRTYCATCAAPATRKNDVDSELKKVVRLMPPAPIQAPSAAKTVLTVEPRPPTVDQRVAIRGLLDKHFDDAAGMYLDGMSDISIAEKVNVARLVVERMREAAYGPLRITPEMAEIRFRIEGLATELNELQKAQKALETRAAKVESSLDEMRASLSKLMTSRAA